MNALRLHQSRPTTARPGTAPARATATNAATPVRHHHRERDFGVGYGNSSGYASARRYAVAHEQPRFRCL